MHYSWALQVPRRGPAKQLQRGHRDQALLVTEQVRDYVKALNIVYDNILQPGWGSMSRAQLWQTLSVSSALCQMLM